MDLDHTSPLLLPQQEESTLPEHSMEGVLLIDEAEKHGGEVEESGTNDDKEVASERGFVVDEESILGSSNTSPLLLPQQEESTLPEHSMEGVLLVDEAEKHGGEIEESRTNDDKEVASEIGFVVDEESMLGSSNTTSLNSSFPAIRAHISDDIDEEEDEVKEEKDEDEDEYKDSVEEEENEDTRSFASIKGYDSASFLASSPEMGSPVGSFSGPFLFSEASINAQQRALRKLNELNTGVPSVDVSMLENVTEEEFRHVVMDIAIAKGLSLDDDILLEILDALVPVVRERIKRDKYENYTRTTIPVAKPTVEDEDEDYTNALYDAEAYGNEGEIINGKTVINLDKLENTEIVSYSALGLPIKGAEDDSDEQDEPILALKNEEEKHMNFEEGSDSKKSDTLDVIHDETEDENASMNMIRSLHENVYLVKTSHDETEDENDSMNMIRSLHENVYLVESYCDDSYPEKQLHETSQLTNRFEAAETSGLSDEIELNPVEGYTDITTDADLQYFLSEITNRHEQNLLHSDNSEFDIDLSLEEDEAMGISGDDDADDDYYDSVSSLLDAFRSPYSSRTLAISDVLSLDVARHSLLVRPQSMPLSTTRSETNDSTVHSNNIDLSEADLDAQKKLEVIRDKFLRLAHRLGQSGNNLVISQVLYRLGLGKQLHKGQISGRAGSFSLERANAPIEEEDDPNDPDFECTIMVIGKSGVGKSATINSLFNESKSTTDAYKPATKKVHVVSGTVYGVKLRVIDTPGLLPSFADQRYNENILSSVKHLIKKSPPDIVLYFDRIDMPNRNYGDLPLLRVITDTLGSSIWFNAMIVLTHASSTTPDGADGLPISYDMFVAQRSHSVQQTIRQVAGDMYLMNPVSLVENHASCQKNRDEQFVLPNGHVWKPQLLLLCFASKLLGEANSLLKLGDNGLSKPFSVRSRQALPLPLLLSRLLHTRAQPTLVDDDDDDSVIETDLDDDDENENEEEDYDDLPPFRNLTKAELTLLDKEQRKIYHEELEYRESLFMKKQLKEERARKQGLKQRGLDSVTEETLDSYVDEEENKSGAVAVPMPDMTLPPSFDSDNPTYRYRYVDMANQWIIRPVLETHGWDHDSGYDGLNIESTFMISDEIPASLSGQISKDKKEGMMQLESNASFKNGEGKVTLTGLDVQAIGRSLAYTLRGETKFDNLKRNRTSCGLAITKLGDAISIGIKLEDRLLIGKQCKIVANGGAIRGRGDSAYGGSLNISVKDKDYPIKQTVSTLGLSLMNWHGDVAIGGNLEAQVKLGSTLLGVHANLNNRGGKITFQANSSEQVQMALIGLIPLFHSCLKRILSSYQTTV